MGSSSAFHQQTRRFQTELLRSTLDAVDWNVTEAARRLGLARSHVYSLIRAFGLQRTEKINGTDSAPPGRDQIHAEESPVEPETAA